MCDGLGASTPDEWTPAVVAENLRSLAGSLPLDQPTQDLLGRAAELVELVDSQAARLVELGRVEARARDFLERRGLASDVAVDTARYIVTGDADA